MNRNTESHFSTLPKAEIRRSIFDLSHKHATTFNAGVLVPILCKMIHPAETWKIDMGAVIRMSTPYHPVMDNCFVDVYFWYVPFRLLWKHTNEFFGENKEAPWTQTTEYEIPQIKAPTNGFAFKSLAHYLGLPAGIKDIQESHLPFRAYINIWNENFRDQNIMNPAGMSMDDTTTQGSANITGAYETETEKGATLLPVCKIHDYFTSCLPQPQKGENVLLPLGEKAPVRTSSSTIPQQSPTSPLKFRNTTWGTIANTTLGTSTTGELTTINNSPTTGTYGTLHPVNLWADLTTATAATVNELRQAFAIQRLLEKDARGGTRYTEIIRSHFGVTSPDARMQRPEYLGGKRIPINMAQVVQMSSSDATSPQGNTAAFSHTHDTLQGFTKSFTEHGYIIGVICARTHNTYQQGIDREWSYKKKLDFIWPTLANIGEQAVLNKEIYAQGTAEDNETFGFQERYGEARFARSRTSGEFDSRYPQSLDVWHYGLKFNQKPTLSPSFITQDRYNIDRTLTVQSSVSDQFIADFWFDIKATKPLPVYSVPGLIDHH